MIDSELRSAHASQLACAAGCVALWRLPSCLASPPGLRLCT